MSSCVYNTVPFISVCQIWTVFILIKRKLKNLHSRKAGFFHHLNDTVCKKTKVLRDHVQFSQIFFEGTEQIYSRSLFPVAELRSLIPVWNRIIFVKSSEMINSHHIIEFHTVGHPACPPCITGLLMVLPVIKRISPELPGSGKSIRRASGNPNRNIILVKLEQFRLCPCIRTVKRNVDRYISNDLHAFLICISFQLCPLFKKPVLLETVKAHFFRKFFSCLSQRIFFSVFKFFWPFDPADPVQAVLDGHIQAVIFQPGSIFIYKLLIGQISFTVIIFKCFS